MYGSIQLLPFLCETIEDSHEGGISMKIDGSRLERFAEKLRREEANARHDYRVR